MNATELAFEYGKLAATVKFANDNPEYARKKGLLGRLSPKQIAMLSALGVGGLGAAGVAAGHHLGAGGPLDYESYLGGGGGEPPLEEPGAGGADPAAVAQAVSQVGQEAASGGMPPPAMPPEQMPSRLEIPSHVGPQSAFPVPPMPPANKMPPPV